MKLHTHSPIINVHSTLEMKVGQGLRKTPVTLEFVCPYGRVTPHLLVRVTVKANKEYRYLTKFQSGQVCENQLVGQRNPFALDERTSVKILTAQSEKNMIDPDLEPKQVSNTHALK